MESVKESPSHCALEDFCIFVASQSPNKKTDPKRKWLSIPTLQGQCQKASLRRISRSIYMDPRASCVCSLPSLEVWAHKSLVTCRQARGASMQWTGRRCWSACICAGWISRASRPPSSRGPEVCQTLIPDLQGRLQAVDHQGSWL